MTFNLRAQMVDLHFGKLSAGKGIILLDRLGHFFPLLVAPASHTQQSRQLVPPSETLDIVVAQPHSLLSLSVSKSSKSSTR
jgi:hypothetical protein